MWPAVALSRDRWHFLVHHQQNTPLTRSYVAFLSMRANTLKFSCVGATSDNQSFKQPWQTTWIGAWTPIHFTPTSHHPRRTAMM